MKLFLRKESMRYWEIVYMPQRRQVRGAYWSTWEHQAWDMWCRRELRAGLSEEQLPGGGSALYYAAALGLVNVVTTILGFLSKRGTATAANGELDSNLMS